MSEDKTKKPNALRSVLAGMVAGATEISITYPAEFAKEKKLPMPPIGLQWYTGCTTLIVGTACKVAVRFLSYDQIKNALSDENGKLSTGRTVLAGMGAGTAESIFAVAPFESVKTALIDDKKSANPKYRGFLHGTVSLYKEGGIRTIYRGLMPTIARQAANSGVRFGVYNTLKQYLESGLAPGEKLGNVTTFLIGTTAGCVNVYVTMPLDVVKTRMQSLQSKQIYGNSLRCAYKIVTEEKITALWAARLAVSGGVIFSIYERAIDFFNWADPQGKYL